MILATLSDRHGKNAEDIRISDYNSMLTDKDKRRIADMVYHRFYGRYIKPFFFNDEQYKKHFKHGFSMMASSCLLIEALESFYQGIEETPRGENADMFKSFFEREATFRAFRVIHRDFYKHVRCGILHQAETTGGFTVRREGPLLVKREINAHEFLTCLKGSLDTYKKRLLNSEWDSEVWDNLRRKMRFIINHCQHA